MYFPHPFHLHIGEWRREIGLTFDAVAEDVGYGKLQFVILVRFAPLPSCYVCVCLLTKRVCVKIHTHVFEEGGVNGSVFWCLGWME